MLNVASCSSSQVDRCSVLAARHCLQSLSEQITQTAVLTGRLLRWRMSSGRVHDMTSQDAAPIKHSFLFSFILLIITTRKCDTLLIWAGKHSRSAVQQLRGSWYRFSASLRGPSAWWCDMGYVVEGCNGPTVLPKIVEKKNNVYFSDTHSYKATNLRCVREKVTKLPCHVFFLRHKRILFPSFSRIT